MMMRFVEQSIEKLTNSGNIVPEGLIERKNRLQAALNARQEEIAFKMSRVPMLKLVDKIYFMAGVSVSWLFSYLMGKHPRDYFLLLFTFLMPVLVFWRWVRYSKIGMHYYLIDLCYFTSALTIYFIWYVPFDERVFRTFFLMANGCVAFSLALFANKMVFHDPDCVTSIGIHGAPMIISYVIRWHLIPEEANWPAERRQFTTISTNLSITDYLLQMVIYPYIFYGIWLSFYFFVTFKISAEKIKKNDYKTLVAYWRAHRWFKAWVERNKEETVPYLYLLSHCGFFTICHCVALVKFHSQWFHFIVVTGYLFVSMWNGANYYMEFFSKRYEEKLAKIEALAGKSLSMEERQRAAWGQ